MSPPRRPQRPALPRQSIGLVRRSAPAGVKTIGSFLPGLTRKAFEKYGFSAASLMTDWPAIAGKDLAQYTAPERLKWRRSPNTVGDEDDTVGKRAGATLVLRVDGARALDVQYQAQQIVERINRYFGYAAVQELRLVQAPVATAAVPPPKRATPAAPPPGEIAGIADAGLRSALARLGAEVRAAR